MPSGQAMRLDVHNRGKGGCAGRYHTSPWIQRTSAVSTTLMCISHVRLRFGPVLVHRRRRPPLIVTLPVDQNFLRKDEGIMFFDWYVLYLRYGLPSGIVLVSLSRIVSLDNSQGHLLWDTLTPHPTIYFTVLCLAILECNTMMIKEGAVEREYQGADLQLLHFGGTMKKWRTTKNLVC